MVPHNRAFVRKLYAIYKYTAKRKKLPFEISLLQFSSLVVRRCLYCKEKPSNNFKLNWGQKYKGEFAYNGLDRIVNEQGYTPLNVVPCCYRCNRIKSDLLSARQMLAAIKAIKKVK